MIDSLVTLIISLVKFILSNEVHKRRIVSNAKKHVVHSFSITFYTFLPERQRYFLNFNNVVCDVGITVMQYETMANSLLEDEANDTTNPVESVTEDNWATSTYAILPADYELLENTIGAENDGDENEFSTPSPSMKFSTFSSVSSSSDEPTTIEHLTSELSNVPIL